MHLAEYLHRAELTYTAFAKMIGEKHPRTVERWAKRQVLPKPHNIQRIADATENRVTATDWYMPPEA